MTRLTLIACLLLSASVHAQVFTWTGAGDAQHSDGMASMVWLADTSKAGIDAAVKELRN